MNKMSFHFKHSLASLGVASLLWIGSPALAQSAPAQDNDTTVQQLASFDGFMDGHPEIAEQLRKDPSLVKNREFVEQHPALHEYLQAHPGVQEEIGENPARFMHQERGFERQETRKELVNLDAFLDSHREIAEQVRKNPSLVNDREFVKNHPDLQQFLQEHGGVAQEWRQNPDEFMREEQRFDRKEDGFEQRGDRDRDLTRGQLASMDHFLDAHPEIAEQLRKDPALVNDKKFMERHPELQTYLQQNPGVREEFKENPSAFMQQEQRFDRKEDRFGQRDQHFDRREGFERNQGFQGNNSAFDRENTREAASFGQFLGVHANIAAQVSNDPTLLNNKEYMETHPELQSYLKSHPAAQAQMQQNPQAFLQSAQQAAVKPSPKAPPMATPTQKQH